MKLRKMTQVLGGGMGMLVAAAATAAHADPVCNSLAGCYQLLKEVQDRIQELHPPATPGPIVRDENGFVLQMTHAEAANHCAKAGSRLPTAKEFALALNPHGVSDTPREGFKAVLKADGKVDFYYDFLTTYVRPSGDDGNWLFRTSST